MVNKTFSKVVGKLPINQKKKSWIKRNRLGIFIGGIYGAIAHLIGYVSLFGQGFPHKVWSQGIIQKIIVFPAYVIESIISFFIGSPSQGLPGTITVIQAPPPNILNNYFFLLIITIIFGIFLGAFIQSILRKMFR